MEQSDLVSYVTVYATLLGKYSPYQIYFKLFVIQFPFVCILTIEIVNFENNDTLQCNRAFYQA